MQNKDVLLSRAERVLAVLDHLKDLSSELSSSLELTGWVTDEISNPGVRVQSSIRSADQFVRSGIARDLSSIDDMPDRLKVILLEEKLKQHESN